MNDEQTPAQIPAPQQFANDAIQRHDDIMRTLYLSMQANKTFLGTPMTRRERFRYWLSAVGDWLKEFPRL